MAEKRSHDIKEIQRQKKLMSVRKHIESWEERIAEVKANARLDEQRKNDLHALRTDRHMSVEQN
jgi:hypothetical protein